MSGKPSTAAATASAHESSSSSGSGSSTCVEAAQQLSPAILCTYKRIARDNAIQEYDLVVQPIGGPGENSYGSVLKVQVMPTEHAAKLPPPSPLHTILKIAPTNAARRAHMRVKEAYTREVFIYARIFEQYYALAADTPNATPFTAVPRMLHASLDDCAEFIIFEDLTHAGYALNSRANLPNYALVVCAFRALAQLHAMSYVLQARQPQLYAKLVAQMDDNLFTADTALVTIEFGKKYVRRTRHMLAEDVVSDKPLLLKALQQIEEHYMEICLDAVNGAAEAPYAAICHGDFWNNNILYEYECVDGEATRAKLIDFQISRHAAPVLDLMHYLYACTEKSLRDPHFHSFMQIYYNTLATVLLTYELDASVVYPRSVFERQLRDYGVYGFCMSALSIPFFVSNANELPELDTVCEAIKELSSSSDSSDTEDNNTPAAAAQKSENAVKLVDDYDLLTTRTLPLFKQRMIGNVLDLHKYKMLDKVMQY